MSLRLKFALAIGGLVAGLFAAYSGALLWKERSHLRAEARRAREDQARQWGLVCRESVLSRDEIMLINYLKELGRNPDVRWAAFLDAEGRLRVHSDPTLKLGIVYPEGPEGLGAPGERVLSGPGGRLRRWTVPVETASGPVGTALLAYDADREDARVAGHLRALLRRFALVAAVSLLAGAGGAWLLSGALTRSLRDLARVAARLGSGDLAARVAPSSRDEVGELAREFNEMADRLSRLDQMKDEFVQTVSHDLRNPLGAILTSVQALQDRRLKFTQDGREEVLSIVRLSAARLLNMVNNLLDVTKIKEGRMEYSLADQRPETLLREAADLFGLQAVEREVALSVEAEKNLPPVRVDPEKALRIIINLLGNALKFTPRGGRIRLKAQVREGQAEFAVEDTGPGIEEKDVSKLFRRFGTLKPADPEQQGRQGTGLGLAIVKALVEGHGGRVWVESTPGRGASFKWTLPLAPGGAG